jgi:hypothetical protein
LESRIGLHQDIPRAWDALGKTFFNEEGYRDIQSKGYTLIPETDFRLGKKLVEEFKTTKTIRVAVKD